MELGSVRFLPDGNQLYGCVEWGWAESTRVPDYFDYFFAAIWLRRRSPRSLSSGVRLAPKSSASKTGRISTSSPGPKGLRLSHSTASSMLRTCQIQKPATSSLVSAKGPSMMVGLAPVKVMRLPLELGWRPSPASITPALTSSSLNLPMLARSLVLGRTPASESLLALTNTMQRIVVSPFIFGWSWTSVDDPCSLSLTSNVGRRDRHAFQDFFAVSIFAYQV